MKTEIKESQELKELHKKISTLQAQKSSLEEEIETQRKKTQDSLNQNFSKTYKQESVPLNKTNEVTNFLNPLHKKENIFSVEGSSLNKQSTKQEDELKEIESRIAEYQRSCEIIKKRQEEILSRDTKLTTEQLGVLIEALAFEAYAEDKKGNLLRILPVCQDLVSNNSLKETSRTEERLGGLLFRHLQDTKLFESISALMATEKKLRLLIPYYNHSEGGGHYTLIKIDIDNFGERRSFSVIDPYGCELNSEKGESITTEINRGLRAIGDGYVGTMSYGETKRLQAEGDKTSCGFITARLIEEFSKLENLNKSDKEIVGKIYAELGNKSFSSGAVELRKGYVHYFHFGKIDKKPVDKVEGNYLPEEDFRKFYEDCRTDQESKKEKDLEEKLTQETKVLQAEPVNEEVSDKTPIVYGEEAQDEDELSISSSDTGYFSCLDSVASDTSSYRSCPVSSSISSKSSEALSINRYINSKYAVDELVESEKLRNFKTGIDSQRSKVRPTSCYRGIGVPFSFSDQGLVIEDVYSPKLKRFKNYFPHNNEEAGSFTSLKHGDVITALCTKGEGMYGQIDVKKINEFKNSKEIMEFFHRECKELIFDLADGRRIVCDTTIPSLSIFMPNAAAAYDDKNQSFSALSNVASTRPKLAQEAIDESINIGKSINERENTISASSQMMSFLDR